ncbi:MAG: hypothetical protein K2K63_04690 [Acetatifactor sp.]|nr:hypothetical protein [Acetatifactor sp.]
MKKGIALSLSLVLMSLLLTSCSDFSAGERCLSPKEMESTHLEMELTDGVLVDAVITPYSRYQNGLNAYYVSMMYREEDLVSGEDFIFSPVIYGYSPEELARLLAEQSGFLPEYVWETVPYPGELIGNLTMRDCMGVERIFRCYWLTDEAGRVDLSPNAVYYDYEGNHFDHNAVCNLLRVAYPDESELDFASSGELAAQAEAILKTLTGEDYYSEVICVPMGEANRQLLKDRGFETGDLSTGSSLYPEEDYYGYLFYRDMDGFPLRYLSLSLVLTENVTWEEELNVQHYQDFLIPFIADKQFVSWGEVGGLRYLSIDRKPNIMGTYKEQESVCDINVILENARQYFDSVLNTSTMTVNHIEIAYSYWFSDAEDGPLRNIAAPFWVVQYWNPASEVQMMLVFDAFSGQFISEVEYQP